MIGLPANLDQARYDDAARRIPAKRRTLSV
jgi:hypothetical protein